MSEKKGIIERLKSLVFKEGSANPKNLRGYILIAALIGIAMMVLGQIYKPDVPQEPSAMLPSSEQHEKDIPVLGNNHDNKPNSMDHYEKEYEEQLKKALEHISGVSDVTVMVNLEATEAKVVEKNSVTQTQKTDETDREGGKRQVEDSSKDEQVVLVRKGDQEEPIIVKTRKPEVRGVLVVASGAENVQVKQWIVESVTRVLNVPSHRVSVMPKSTKGE
ncbi:stage III sporulation protein AG [Bacillus tianshenii]|nr:stage III sporulation protein AG [Bacillus tianshenii]